MQLSLIHEALRFKKVLRAEEITKKHINVKT